MCNDLLDLGFVLICLKMKENNFMWLRNIHGFNTKTENYYSNPYYTLCKKLQKFHETF